MTIGSNITEAGGPTMTGADALIELIRNPDAYDSKLAALAKQEETLRQLTGTVETINEANALLAKAKKTLESAELNAGAIKAAAADEIETQRDELAKSRKLLTARKKGLDDRESEINGTNAFVDGRVKDVEAREQECLRRETIADSKMKQAEATAADYKERKAKLAAALKGV